MTASVHTRVAETAAAERRGERAAAATPGRAYLVINPGARGGRGWRIAARYRALLQAGGARSFASLECGYTRTLEDAGSLARQALARGCDTIVAVGGDGTINRVLGAFLDPACAGAQARLGVLYAGTSPDFCRFHRLPIDPAAAVAVLCRGVARPIDVGRIEHRDALGRRRVEHFASSVNIGLGAGIAARANRLRPRLGDFGGTLLASVIAIAGQGPRRMRLLLDGEAIDLPPALNISVGKNPHLAGGLKLDIPMTADDGRLFVFAVCGVGRHQLLAALPRIYSGRITRDARFLLRRASVVRIEPVAGEQEIEFDGDPAGWCPAEIRVLPRAVRLIGGAP